MIPVGLPFNINISRILKDNTPDFVTPMKYQDSNGASHCTFDEKNNILVINSFTNEIPNQTNMRILKKMAEDKNEDENVEEEEEEDVEGEEEDEEEEEEEEDEEEEEQAVSRRRRRGRR